MAATPRPLPVPHRLRDLRGLFCFPETALLDADTLFELGRAPTAELDYLSGEIPILYVDGIYRDPERVRREALALPFEPAPAMYPGRVARVAPDDASLTAFLRNILALVTRHYLPHVRLPPDGRRPGAIKGIDTDFAITDQRPETLHAEQRRPHVDAVPVFGLIYLNEVERGGTLFFRPEQGTRAAARDGYPAAAPGGAGSLGRIEGRFNRLAIYPGFIPHSGEIAGEWIHGEERLSEPRLTQRLMFFL
jgi:hypothetical protein